MHPIFDCSQTVEQLCKDGDGDAEEDGYSCLRTLYVPDATQIIFCVTSFNLGCSYIYYLLLLLGTWNTERINNLPKATQIISGRVWFSSRQCDHWSHPSDHRYLCCLWRKREESICADFFFMVYVGFERRHYYLFADYRAISLPAIFCFVCSLYWLPLDRFSEAVFIHFLDLFVGLGLVWFILCRFLWMVVWSVIIRSYY